MKRALGRQRSSTELNLRSANAYPERIVDGDRTDREIEQSVRTPRQGREPRWDVLALIGFR